MLLVERPPHTRENVPTSHLYFGVISALTEIDQHYPGTSLVFFTDGHQAPALFPGREPKYERRDNRRTA
ncbi:MAG: hypothetical protein U1E63_11365 [Burkholderiales bacterium]